MALSLIEWLALAQVVALLGSGLLNMWLFFSVRGDARWKSIGEAITQGDAGLGTELTRIDRHHGAAQAVIDRRLSVLETRIEAMPDHDDLTEVSGQLARIDRSVSGLAERSQSTQESVRRIERHLLESKR